ncbi:MAG TPA: cadmium-translocating P-type ATPase [Candidatus Limiplasma pullicola]|nr:cadmium-translocating P-type ATPase [Candidatus Limiplasma pullicola]
MSRRQKRDLLRIAVAAVLFLAGLLVPDKTVRLILFLLAYLTVGLDVLKEAGEGIVHGQLFDENFLMSIATLGAMVVGEYPEAVAVMLLYHVGELFQSYAVGKSRASIASLMDIRPETAAVERDGGVVTVDPEEVAVGEVFVLKAGDRVPLDGVVLEGTSALNTAALTGESMPRDVAPGDEVISGCINQTGLLRVRATKLYTDSTVARILELVENASDKKARVETFITRFARVYTPAVCGAALLLFLIPSLFVDGRWADWGMRALSFLVVSCPCALVISVPLSFFGGIGGAGKCGILVKGSNYLEALAKADIVVFDKTGTLTRGVFHVTVVHPDQISEEELLRIAATVENASDHPIGRSICAGYHGELALDQLTGVRELPGEGMSAVLDGATVSVGNEKLMHSLGVELPDCPHAGTVVHVARDGAYLGHIVISDQIKEGSQEAIAALKHEGVRRTVILTGDSQAVAQDVAAKLGVDEAHAQLLPAQKVEQVERLLNEKKPGGTLVFAGDGINDAPVLTRADVGVAMGALGSDAAVEAADVVLMDDDPRKLATAIRISRRTLAITRQSIVFALAVKLLVLVLVAAGVANMWWAVFADVGVSVLAILNAMRALRVDGL